MSCCWNCGKETIGLKKVRLIDKSAETEIALDFLKNVPYESKINKLEEVVIKTEM